MRWRGVLLSLLCLAPLGESTDRLSRFWSANLGAETSPLYKWSVTSAGIFVAVALVLSMYLIFEHLAAYNKPEVCLFRCSDFIDDYLSMGNPCVLYGLLHSPILS